MLTLTASQFHWQARHYGTWVQLFCFTLMPCTPGMPQDQASKDSRAAEKAPDGDVDDPGAKPMVPILRLLPSQYAPCPCLYLLSKP